MFVNVYTPPQNPLTRIILFILNKLEHVYMRPEVNSGRFEISLWDKISLRCKVTALFAFT